VASAVALKGNGDGDAVTRFPSVFLSRETRTIAVGKP